jgi:hypothetical protein
MSFQTYLNNIEAKTGVSPERFLALAKQKGLATDDGIAPGIKSGQIVAWLQSDFALGHGHAMAIVALIKGKRK